MRIFLFKAAYWSVSIVFALLAMPLVILPSRKPMMFWIRTYTKLMTLSMRWIIGIKLDYRGKHHIPDGPCIIAAKHQSWGDGFSMFSQIKDLAFVTGNHLEKMPLLGSILRKMGAIVVDNCGGAYARAKLIDTELKEAQKQNRKILIYPEGHLSKVGTRHRYRKGVFHMYQSYNRPVIPVATNLGLYWPENSWNLKSGTAVIEFLDPIAPGLPKEEFMKTLEATIEKHSLALLPDDFEISPLDYYQDDKNDSSMQKTNSDKPELKPQNLTETSR